MKTEKAVFSVIEVLVNTDVVNTDVSAEPSSETFHISISDMIFISNLKYVTCSDEFMNDCF